MIQVHITMTGKSYSPRAEWTIFAEDKRSFPDLATAKAWLRDKYGAAKRAPMYRDSAEGTKQIGYVIGFRAADLSHHPVEKWLQQDWISFHECRPIDPDTT